MKVFILATLVEDRKVTAITMMVWSSAIRPFESHPASVNNAVAYLPLGQRAG